MIAVENSILIEQRAVEPFFKNGYIVACPDTRQGIYIDPGQEAAQLMEWVEKNDVELTALVNTHAHIDHICGIRDVISHWDLPIYLHPDDQFLYQGLEEQARFFGLHCPAAPAADYALEEGKDLVVGRLRFQVYHTPGHSPGGVCLEILESVFCGDTLFAGSVGRTDLPGGSHDTLIRSIKEKILPLGDEKTLYPGHGPPTTVRRERETNPFLADRFTS